MTTLEVLKAAREKIAQGWTQGHNAIDAEGRGVAASGRDGCAWCAFGALLNVTTTGDGWGAVSALQKQIPNNLDLSSLSVWNDAPGRTQAEVLALFDKAIAAEEARK